MNTNIDVLTIGNVLTIGRKYLEGYKVGLYWDANYRPGGPHVYANLPETALTAKAYLAGFDDGWKERIAVSSHYAEWLAANPYGNNCRVARYTVPTEIAPTE